MRELDTVDGEEVVIGELGQMGDLDAYEVILVLL